jgi:hypothetical protein
MGSQQSSVRPLCLAIRPSKLAASRLRTPDGRHSASAKDAHGIRGSGHEADGDTPMTQGRNHPCRPSAKLAAPGCATGRKGAGPQTSGAVIEAVLHMHKLTVGFRGASAGGSYLAVDTCCMAKKLDRSKPISWTSAKLAASPSGGARLRRWTNPARWRRPRRNSKMPPTG